MCGRRQARDRPSAQDLSAQGMVVAIAVAYKLCFLLKIADDLRGRVCAFAAL